MTLLPKIILSVGLAAGVARAQLPPLLPPVKHTLVTNLVVTLPSYSIVVTSNERGHVIATRVGTNGQTLRELIYTNADGSIYAFKDTTNPPPTWQAFVITGLQTSTNLTDWLPVGWRCDTDPQRFFRQATNGLGFQLVTFTNQIK